MILLTALFSALEARADSTQTLPAGVRSMQLRLGYVSGIDETYGSGGQLTTLGDSKAITFNAVTLARTNAEAQNLINALNSLGSQNLGSQINLGTLRVDTKPRISYEAPVFAYGLTKKWTIGVGLPVIQYSNDVHLSAEGSNADAYKRLGLTGFSTQLDRALNIDLISEVGKLLASRGYKPLQSKPQTTFLADAQLAALYQIERTKNFEAVYQATLTLPTGPANDPDDLLAANLYGRTALENGVALGFKLGQSFVFVPHGALVIYAPDNVQARVPSSEDDTLPDASQKQTVHRQLGMTAKAGTDLNWLMSTAWTSSVGTELMRKGPDKYTGDSSLRYDLMSKDTDAQSVRARAGLTYSSVRSYMKKRSAVPGIIGLELSDVLSGINVLRETRAELSFMLFF